MTPDPWNAWDERVRATDRPARVAASLTDEELLNLLASDAAGARKVEKGLLKREAHDRLARARGPQP